jgi:dCMP deaminase
MKPWDDVFMNMASAIAERSKDTTKVGAVIVDMDNRVVSCGFNGDPRALFNSTKHSLEKRFTRIHAEMNAILYARADISGYVMYCTHHPCVDCAKVICQSGISEVVFGDGVLVGEYHLNESLELMQKCGVRVRKHAKC